MSHFRATRPRSSGAAAFGSVSASGEPADPLMRLAYGLVLTAVALVTCNALRAGANVALGDVPLTIAGVLVLVVWVLRGHPAGVVPSGLLVGAFLLVATGIFAIVPTNSTDSLVPTLRFAVTLTVMPVILMLVATTPQRVERLVDFWLLGAAVNCVVGALDIVGVTHVGLSLTGVDFVGSGGRAPGLTTHVNHLGLVAAMALPIAVARLGGGGRRGRVALGLVPLLIVGVAESGSRGAFLAAAAGVMLFFVFGVSARRTRTTVALLAAPLVAFATLAAVLGTSGLTGSVTLSRFSGSGGAAQSNAVRVDTLRTSIDAVIAQPAFGDGFGVVRTAHNIYVQMAQAGGLLALAGFLAFAVAMLRRARWLALPAHGLPPRLMALAAGSGASLGVWLLYGMVGNAVYDRYLYIPIGVTLGLSLVNRRLAGGGEPSRAPGAHRRRSGPRAADGEPTAAVGDLVAR